VATDLQPSSTGAVVRVTSATRVPLMPEQLNLSESAWAQLDLLQQHLNVILEVLDSSMHPLASAAGGEPSQALDHAGVEAEIAKSLRTGEVRVYRPAGGVPVGIFPLRVARHIAGCLVVLPKPTRQAAAEPATEARIEGAGLLARTALEADLSLNDQLIDVRYRNRRVHGILKFLLQLGADPDNEREMMKAVIQAATVWFDADCRIYQRQPDDSFLLAAMLPGATEQRGGVRLEPMRVEKLVASRRLTSAGDLEELGLHGRRDEVVVLPVGPVSRPVWLLVIAGTIDQEIELTFSAIARVLAGVLQTREAVRVERWQQRLAAFMSEPHRAPERIILSLLEALATGAGAVGARVTLIGPGESRALAALGQTAKPGQEKAGDEGVSEHLDVGSDTRLRVTLWPAPGAARTAAADLRSWVTALRPWLLNTVSNLTEAPVVADPAFMSTFERRIQEEVERAKRFNLGLGLVVIGSTAEPAAAAVLENLLDAVRPDIRASDLTGRLSGDMVAIVLVHTEAGGADTVLARVKRRLESMGSGRHKRLVHLGMAVYTPELGSADSLIAEALRAGQRVELRN
jgi:GGDEF domain-containing protein